jgi:hypothetical protein
MGWPDGFNSKSAGPSAPIKSRQVFIASRQTTLGAEWCARSKVALVTASAAAGCFCAHPPRAEPRRACPPHRRSHAASQPVFSWPLLPAHAGQTQCPKSYCCNNSTWRDLDLFSRGNARSRQLSTEKSKIVVLRPTRPGRSSVEGNLDDWVNLGSVVSRGKVQRAFHAPPMLSRTAGCPRSVRYRTAGPALLWSTRTVRPLAVLCRRATVLSSPAAPFNARISTALMFPASRVQCRPADAQVRPPNSLTFHS